MKLHRSFVVLSAVLLSLTVFASLVLAITTAIIYNGPNLVFTKLNNTGIGPANQDCIVSGICLTRLDAGGGLINASSETTYDDPSPAGTEWAFQGLNGNPSSGVTASNRASLVFANFSTALEDNVGLNIVGTPGVLHLIASDIYIDITFSAWTRGNGQEQSGGGGFSYTRSTPGTQPVATPAPPSLILLCTGLGGAALYQLRRRFARR